MWLNALFGGDFTVTQKTQVIIMSNNLSISMQSVTVMTGETCYPFRKRNNNESNLVNS